MNIYLFTLIQSQIYFQNMNCIFDVFTSPISGGSLVLIFSKKNNEKKLLIQMIKNEKVN